MPRQNQRRRFQVVAGARSRTVIFCLASRGRHLQSAVALFKGILIPVDNGW